MSITLYRNSCNLAHCVSDKMQLKNMIFAILWGNFNILSKKISTNIYLQYSLYVTVRSVRDCSGLFVGAVYLAGVRLMTHIIIFIEMVSISLDS